MAANICMLIVICNECCLIKNCTQTLLLLRLKLFSCGETTAQTRLWRHKPMLYLFHEIVPITKRFCVTQGNMIECGNRGRKKEFLSWTIDDHSVAVAAETWRDFCEYKIFGGKVKKGFFRKCCRRRVMTPSSSYSSSLSVESSLLSYAGLIRTWSVFDVAYMSCWGSTEATLRETW